MSAATERQILDALGHVTDPDKGADIVSLGMISGLVIRDGNVAFAIEVESEELLRRVTELTDFPATGSILRGVPAVIEPRGGGFRLFVPQELSQYAAETIDDLRSRL